MTHNTYPNMHATMTGQTLLPGQQMYSSFSTPNTQQENTNIGMDNISNSLGNVSLRNTATIGLDNFGNTTLPASNTGANTVSGGKINSQVFYQLHDGNYIYARPNPSHTNHDQYSSTYNWSFQHPLHSQYQPAPYQNIGSAVTTSSLQTPRGPPWIPTHGVPPVPELVAPHKGYPSDDETSPVTPNYTNYPLRGFFSGQSNTPWSTPSPLSSQWPTTQIGKGPNGDPIFIDFFEKANEHPIIPAPVPAPHSGEDGGRGTLDKILDNREGTTNVYVRGLQPNTTDEMLYSYGRRFGPIVSQKAIIDHSTNACKGFGFIKYHNFPDAENCIRGFFHCGYEAKFARKSHNSRLKDLADESNNNLYISNLPKSLDEHGLEDIFQTVFPLESYPDYKAGPCRILRDPVHGISRGVGFARFRTPQICNEMIEAFNNRSIGEGKSATTLQIRFADTEDQKKLKQYTAVKRQFKANEYNEAVYGIPFNNYTPTSETLPSPLQARGQVLNGSWVNQSPASSGSPCSYGPYPYSMLRARQTPSNGFATAADNGSIEVAPPTTRYTNRIKIESPDTTNVEDGDSVAVAKNNVVGGTEDLSVDGDSSSKSESSAFVEKPRSGTSFTSDEIVKSPTKSKL